jgi:hypothetical protein
VFLYFFLICQMFQLRVSWYLHCTKGGYSERLPRKSLTLRAKRDHATNILPHFIQRIHTDHYWLTNSTEQSPGEANSRSTSVELSVSV